MRRLTALLLLLVLATAAHAQAPDPDGGLTGVLKRVQTRGSVLIGYREAFPFSYTFSGRPIGYTLDLCRGIVSELEREVDRGLRIDFVPLTAETRFDAVASGKVDFECSSSTANAEREKLVAFSPITFVAGTKLLVQRDSPVRSYRDLGGRTVAVQAGTTNEEVMRRLAEKGQFAGRVVTVPDHEHGIALVESGGADAYASDDVLLYGLIARNKARARLIVVGDFLSYEPYGIAFARNDPAVKEAVQRAFETMARERDLIEYYHRWFERPLPGGETMNMPTSAQLANVFRLLGVEE
jgi:glutamate/aspartate transport system substrate-binding protein